MKLNFDVPTNVKALVGVELNRFYERVAGILGLSGPAGSWNGMVVLAQREAPRATITIGADGSPVPLLAFVLGSELAHEQPNEADRYLAAARYCLRQAVGDQGAEFAIAVELSNSNRPMVIGLGSDPARAAVTMDLAAQGFRAAAKQGNFD